MMRAEACLVAVAVLSTRASATAAEANASQVEAKVLLADEVSSPPGPPEEIPVYQRVIGKYSDQENSHLHFPPLLVQTISTVTVCTFLALAGCAIRLYFKKKQKDALGGLPAAQSDGTWLLVTYDWGHTSGQSGRMPLEGIASISDLVCAVVEYGSESVDADISSHNIDVRYTDAQGVERRLGAKTRFSDVQGARMLRITKRVADSRERTGLMWGITPNSKRVRKKQPAIQETVEEGEEEDDISIIEANSSPVQMMPVT